MLTGLNKYAFSSEESPAAPAFQVARHVLRKEHVGITQIQSSKIRKSRRVLRVFTDTQTSMLSGIPESAICVQRFDDSLNSAIHITYRISLRSSSMREPRDPSLKVLLFFFSFQTWHTVSVYMGGRFRPPNTFSHPPFCQSVHCGVGRYLYKKIHD